jgi:hypothetical protein
MPPIQFKNIAPKKSSDERDLEELLSELYQMIPVFIESPIFNRDIFEASDENHYTETLVKYLENEKRGSRFSYKQQASLPNKRSTDIGVHLKADSEHYIFNIEAKFLPPNDYVAGEYAAIKRYKKNEHGLSNRNPTKAKKLLESAILGYSKSGTFENHLENINKSILKLSQSKIADKFGLIWYDTEQLQEIKIDKSAIFVSKHPRYDNSSIKLYHFWVTIPITISTHADC